MTVPSHNPLLEGAWVTINGVTFAISYRGGPGSNDVVLIEPGPVTTTGTSGADHYELRRSGSGLPSDDLQLLLNGAVIDSRPMSTVIGWTINAGDGADSLLVNYGYSGGFFSSPVNFNGESPGLAAAMTRWRLRAAASRRSSTITASRPAGRP